MKKGGGEEGVKVPSPPPPPLLQPFSRLEREHLQCRLRIPKRDDTVECESVVIANMCEVCECKEASI